MFLDRLTFRLLPVVSLSASKPPGPILLLRDFLEGRSPSAALFWAIPNAPMSAVIFSLSIVSGDGICAIDLRDLGLVADRVTSSLEDIVAKLILSISPGPIATLHPLFESA